MAYTLPHPIRIIRSQRSAQRDWCNNLKHIADQLPKTISQQAVETACEKLRDNLPIYHQNEESLYFFISEQIPERANWAQVLELIKEEHLVHQDYANELQACLSDDLHRYDINYLGYMLRYFFETIGRHLDWEEVTLMAMATELEPDVDWSWVSSKLVFDLSNSDLH